MTLAPRLSPRRLAGLAALLLALPPGARAQTVDLKDIEFSPQRIEADAGDTLTFVNRDPFEHDVYIVNAANRNLVVHPATVIPAGDTLRVPVEESGVLNLYCTIHGGMTGKITTTGSFELTEAQKKKAAARKTVPPIAKKGESLFWGEAQCHQCHRVGDRGDGTRGPDLSDIGFRAGPRAERLDLDSGTEYLVQSIMEPGAHVVEGYTDDMATVYWPPIDLGRDQIQAVVAYLQSQGGEVDTWGISVDESRLGSEPPMNPFRAGDPERGAAVWEEMECASCHAVSGEPSTSAGPDLTDIGAYRNWTWLAESLLQPNAEIGRNWTFTTVYYEPEDARFVSETSVNGFIRRNTEEEVAVLTMSKDTVTLPGDRVLRVQEQESSKMPTNYGELMTFREVADLVAYLESLE